MSVRVAGDIIHVEGVAQVGDAEPLLAALLDDRARAVDLTAASRLHSANVQVLLALRPRIIGAPSDPFQNGYMADLLDTGQR